MRLLSQSFGRFGRLSPAIASGFDFYVDSVNGSDSATGRGPGAQAWATLGKLVTAGALANGVKIGLARGSAWRETLDVSSYTGCTVGTYGSESSPRPTVNASDTASAAGWALTGGRTKAYDRSWSHNVTTGNYIRMWNPDGTEPTWVSSAATCESTPNSYFVSNTWANPATIYYHPPGSTAPAEGAEITKRDYAVKATGGNTIVGVVGKRQGHNDGSLVASVLRECIALDGSKHNAYSSQAYDCVFAKTSNPSGRWGTATMHVSYGGGALAHVENCYAIGSGYASVTGFYAHTVGGSTYWDQVNHIELYAYNVDQVMAAADTVSYLIRDCFSEKHGYFTVAPQNPSTSVTVIDNVTAIATSADGSSPSQPQRLISGGPNGAGSSITVTDFRFYSNNHGTSGSLFYALGCTLNVTASTFYITGTGFSILYSSSGSNLLWTGSNNILFNVDKVFEYTNAAGEPALSDYNVVYSSGAVENRIRNTNYANWTNYRAAWPSLDANSSTSNPLFNSNPQTAGDFSLQAGTPADTGGRAAGSRLHIPPPDWAAIQSNAEAGYLPWETVPA